MAGAKVEIIRYLEWAETDAAGHQHYTSAFRWVEECEAALYRSVGLPSTLFGQIPRVKVQMEYKRRIFFGEQIKTNLEVTRIGNSSAEFAFTAACAGVLPKIKLRVRSAATLILIRLFCLYFNLAKAFNLNSILLA